MNPVARNQLVSSDARLYISKRGTVGKFGRQRANQRVRITYQVCSTFVEPGQCQSWNEHYNLSAIVFYWNHARKSLMTSTQIKPCFQCEGSAFRNGISVLRHSGLVGIFSFTYDRTTIQGSKFTFWGNV